MGMILLASLRRILRTLAGILAAGVGEMLDPHLDQRRGLRWRELVEMKSAVFARAI